MSKSNTPRKEPKYWVVGGMYFNGTEDHSDEFFGRGFWEMRPDSPKVTRYLPLISQISAGDAIALKRRYIRPGSFQIRVVARGIVLAKADKNRRVKVEWTDCELDFFVPGRGCGGSVHGPFAASDPWTRKVFGLH